MSIVPGMGDLVDLLLLLPCCARHQHHLVVVLVVVVVVVEEGPSSSVVVGIFSLPSVGVVFSSFPSWSEVRVTSLGSDEGSSELLGTELAPPHPAANARISAESRMPADVRT